MQRMHTFDPELLRLGFIPGLGTSVLTAPRWLCAPPSGPGALDLDPAWAERIVQMSPTQAAVDLWLRLRLSPYNEHLWTGQPTLLLREALALRNRLNPAALFAPRAPYDSFKALVAVYGQVPGDPLGQLALQFEALLWRGWFELRVPYVGLTDQDEALDSAVPRALISQLFNWCDPIEFPEIDFRPRQTDPLEHAGVQGAGPVDGTDYETPLLRIIDDLRAMFDQAQACGCYIPEKPETVPLVGNYLSKYYPELEPRLRELVLRAVRPPWYPLGSPGRRGHAFGEVVPDIPEAQWCFPAEWFRQRAGARGNLDTRHQASSAGGAG